MGNTAVFPLARSRSTLLITFDAIGLFELPALGPATRQPVSNVALHFEYSTLGYRTDPVVFRIGTAFMTFLYPRVPHALGQHGGLPPSRPLPSPRVLPVWLEMVDFTWTLKYLENLRVSLRARLTLARREVAASARARSSTGHARRTSSAHAAWSRRPPAVRLSVWFRLLYHIP